ncbi:MAG: hypothetical protein ACK4G3_07375 [bacterium]
MLLGWRIGGVCCLAPHTPDLLRNFLALLLVIVGVFHFDQIRSIANPEAYRRKAHSGVVRATHLHRPLTYSPVIV